MLVKVYLFKNCNTILGRTIFAEINGLDFIADIVYIIYIFQKRRKDMNEINTKKFADEFCDMIQSLMMQFECVGNWKWGNPDGLTEYVPTYELITNSGCKVWCSIMEYVNTGTGIANRKGILATFPASKQQSLGSIMSTMIPYEFSRAFSTRAYASNSKVEIRNYGKVTAGRAGIKKEKFFKYMEKFPQSVFLDEENRKYVIAYQYKERMTKHNFAEQTYRFTKLLYEFKQQCK